MRIAFERYKLQRFRNTHVTTSYFICHFCTHVKVNKLYVKGTTQQSFTKQVLPMFLVC